MPDLQLYYLQHPYDNYLKLGAWKKYVSSLSEDGLQWWFNMEAPRVAVHIQALYEHCPDIVNTHRLSFLTAISERVISADKMDELYKVFEEIGDCDAAAAAAAAGSASVWDSGTDFMRFTLWRERITRLLENKQNMVPLAVASILGYKALIEMVLGDYISALTTNETQLKWAERADSNSLQVYHAASNGMCNLFLGDFSKVEIVLRDAAPIAQLEDTSFICKVYYDTVRGLAYAFMGKVQDAIDILSATVSHPFFELLPPSIWLWGHGHLLMALAFAGKKEEVESVSIKIENRAIPQNNHFNHAYAHYNRGVAAFVLGDPYKAMLHGREAIKRSRMSGSPVSEHISNLLLGQALSELDELDEAYDHLSLWMDKWEQAGFRFYTAVGATELANILMKKGRIEEARNCLTHAVEVLPHGVKPPALHRTPDFVQKLQNMLIPDSNETSLWIEQEKAVVCIKTFGELEININGHVVYDRKWRGGRTKLLLKAIIVHGGSKVSIDHLTDLLWPDAEGDRAMNNFKVTLSRLKRIGCEEDQEPVPWVVVRHRHVSLVKSLCYIDAYRFASELERGIAHKNHDQIAGALDLYQGDFLAFDNEESWIVRYREIIKQRFMKGVLMLSDIAINNGSVESAISYLRKSLELQPLYEELYAQLMRCYLQLDYRAEVLQVYEQAKRIFNTELGIEPGKILVSLAQEAKQHH